MSVARFVGGRRGIMLTVLVLVGALVALMLQTIGEPASAQRDGEPDPLIGSTYQLELGGENAGYFTEGYGMGSENEVVENKIVTPGGQEIVIKIPGRVKFGDIVLKRGVTSNMDLWEWRDQVVEGDIAGARTNGSIIMLSTDPTGVLTEVARWDFTNAWPSKLVSNEVGVEEVTIVVEFIERVP